MDLSRVSYILKKVCSLQPNEPVIVGISGGPDSLALFHILKTLGYQMLPAHFDHLLRPGSTKDADMLEAMLSKMGASLLRGSASVAAYADQHKLSTEEAARILRYQFLFEQARKIQAQAVITAHTADDQVETILMHIIRGSGLNGLVGITSRQIPNAWDDAIPLIRPLLDVRRNEILEYCSENNLQPFIDETNTDIRYMRNRIRNWLIPNLETHYNPQVKNAILRLSQSARDETEIVNHAIEEAWERCIHDRGNGYLRFHLEEMIAQPMGMQRQIIRRALGELAENKEEVGYEVIRRVIDFLPGASSNKKIQLIEGIYTAVTGSFLLFCRAECKEWLELYPHTDTVRILEEGRYLDLGTNWCIRLSRVKHYTGKPGIIDMDDLNQAVIDADRLSGSLILRKAIPGERFEPFGMDGNTVKVSDFFANEKLPGQARTEYPIVVSGEQVVWIPGYRLAHPFRITRDTKNYLVIQLVSRRAEL